MCWHSFSHKGVTATLVYRVDRTPGYPFSRRKCRRGIPLRPSTNEQQDRENHCLRTSHHVHYGTFASGPIRVGLLCVEQYSPDHAVTWRVHVPLHKCNASRYQEWGQDPPSHALIMLRIYKCKTP